MVYSFLDGLDRLQQILLVGQLVPLFVFFLGHVLVVQEGFVVSSK
jgi:hypothetical protein